ncbi:MAG TPA: farnesyl diphosphate synthase [Candidatus Ozemobacteraceae bacterium]
MNAVTESAGKDLERRLQGCRLRVDEALERWLPPADAVPPKLHEAMRYSVCAGGKRIRPALCLITAEGFGAAGEGVLRAACALELLHTYSLIHDDLPAMDDDDLRRGRPTNHKVFGEAMAILAGDALQTLAFEWMSGIGRDGLPADRVLAAVSRFAEASGHAGMVGGQVLDIEGEQRRISLDELRRIHRLKTGALLEVSIGIGGILGGARPEELALLSEYGHQVGLLFQIIDDILDVEGAAADLGKTPGSDVRHGKSTYPSLLGLDGAKREAARARDNAVAACSKLPRPIPELPAIADWLLARNR